MGVSVNVSYVSVHVCVCMCVCMCLHVRLCFLLPELVPRNLLHTSFLFYPSDPSCPNFFTALVSFRIIFVLSCLYLIRTFVNFFHVASLCM